MKMRREYVASLIIGFILLSSSKAGGQIGVAALKGIQNRPQLIVAVSQRRRSVTSPLDIYVRVANLTEKDIFLKGVQVIMPGEFLAARQQTDWNRILSYSKEEQITPGNERMVPFAIPNEDLSWFAPLLNFQLLSFLPTEYDVRVVATYKVPPAKDTVVQEISKIYIEPPLSSLIFGAVLGSFLLALFVGTYRLLRRRGLRQQVVEALILLSAGSVCGVITIILLYRIKGLPLPLNLNVNDFYGGIAIGLCSYKLGDWLFMQFFSGSGSQGQTIASLVQSPEHPPPEPQ